MDFVYHEFEGAPRFASFDDLESFEAFIKRTGNCSGGPGGPTPRELKPHGYKYMKTDGEFGWKKHDKRKGAWVPLVGERAEVERAYGIEVKVEEER